ncbi:hypothetical protein [Clostridium sp.]|uniref:hypothetical protein n=1 Tax=Clostridium sp. TaxID=1506 RepID=UPI0029078108|nr:hypothetical protein [Clostridium sp.]MDU5107767.1 hypothetical protein [Clostridium sp.]
MKRIPEFTCGLIGSILGTIIAIIAFILLGFRPSTETISGIGFVSNGIGIIIGIVAIVFACLINKNTKVSSIVLIITGTILFFTNFLQIIPLALLLVAGIMGLIRKVN